MPNLLNELTHYVRPRVATRAVPTATFRCWRGCLRRRVVVVSCGPLLRASVMAELAFWRCGHLLLAGPGGCCCRGGLRRRCGPGSRAGGALSADGCRFVGRGQCPAEWWGLRVDLRCLRAAVDRGGGVSIAGRVELGHGALGAVAELEPLIGIV